MSLNPADIATVSRLLDEALALPAEQRDAWLAALLGEHQRHAETLRQMLAREAELDTDSLLESLPRVTPDESVARPGDLIGPYRLRHEIGRGGMGSVWLAERADGSFKRQVALKLPRLAWGSGLAERMARERDIGALLEHPNIARLYDAGVDERGRPYLALEYIDGQAIDAWCEVQNLSVRERLRLFVPVARAVAYAHGRLVVHRDLKPSNVLVTPDGQVHLLDFGIAKLLQEGAADEPGLTQQQGRVMTPHYASPEQVAGEAITVQSDVYSLGVLLYELLTGTLPIAPKRSTLGAVEEAVLQGDAPLASSRVKDRTTARALRGEVDAILAKAMQREPARRYATSDAMAQDIERHLAGETVAARPDSLGYRMRKAVRRHWVGVTAAAAVMVALLTGAGVALTQGQRAARAAERERVVKAFVGDMFRLGGGARRGDPGSRETGASPTWVQSGAELLRARFADQPQLQAELFGVISAVFSDMGAPRQAMEYSVRQVDLLSKLDVDAATEARALIDLAGALHADKQLEPAAARLRQSLELARGDAAVSADARVRLAGVLIDQNLPDQAEAAVEAAGRDLRVLGDSPSPTRAWLTVRRAQLLVRRNQSDLSLPLFRQAIDEALNAEGPASRAAIDIRLKFAVVLAVTLRSEEAARCFDAAIAAMNSLGGPHAARSVLETAKFAHLRYTSLQQGTAQEARAVLERSLQTLAAMPLQLPDWFIPQIEVWLGNVLMFYGDVQGAKQLLGDRADSLWRLFTVPVERIRLANLLASSLMYAGEHAAADRWFRERLELKRKAGLDRDPDLASDHRWIARNLSMQGRYADALAALDAAPAFDSSRGKVGINQDRHNRVLIWTRATVLRDMGDAQGALALLEKSAPGALEHEFDRNSYSGRLSLVLCGAGRYAEGVKLLSASLAREEQKPHHPGNPWLAADQAYLGLCQLNAGHRAAALAMAAKARVAFLAQPDVSPYFKASLADLERALRLRLPPI